MPDKPMSEHKRKHMEKYPGDAPLVGGAWGALIGALGGFSLIEIPQHFHAARLDDKKPFGALAKIGEFLSKESLLSRASAIALVAVPVGLLAKLNYDVAKERKAHYEGMLAEREEIKGQLALAGNVINAMQAENDALKHQISVERKNYAAGLKSTAEHGSHAEALQATGEQSELAR